MVNMVKSKDILDSIKHLNGWLLPDGIWYPTTRFVSGQEQVFQIRQMIGLLSEDFNPYIHGWHLVIDGFVINLYTHGYVYLTEQQKNTLQRLLDYIDGNNLLCDYTEELRNSVYDSKTMELENGIMVIDIKENDEIL